MRARSVSFVMQLAYDGDDLDREDWEVVGGDYYALSRLYALDWGKDLSLTRWAPAASAGRGWRRARVLLWVSLAHARVPLCMRVGCTLPRGSAADVQTVLPCSQTQRASPSFSPPPKPHMHAHAPAGCSPGAAAARSRRCGTSRSFGCTWAPVPGPTCTSTPRRGGSWAACCGTAAPS